MFYDDISDLFYFPNFTARFYCNGPMWPPLKTSLCGGQVLDAALRNSSDTAHYKFCIPGPSTFREKKGVVPRYTATQ